MTIDFKTQKGIFLQIADNICREIVEGKLTIGERIPSVRDLAAEYEVNRNTILRTYQILSDDGVIENQRGIGSFVTHQAVEIIQNRQRAEFFSNDLPEFIKKVKLLGIKEKDLGELMGVIG
ncbi:MAG: GntR family transcriptional regulator [Dysgonamonadaceae bacterium]|jgi:DNA-binding transcriptional regulator YhcF (GntR family)|nr:GntR family transcriptional regulator [Dysgonamonadaceae bacterium]